MSSSLHNHTEYSILDGFGHPEEYLKKAKEIGLKAFAITEHGNEYSWVYFDELKKNYPEIKMIYGVEFYECFDHLQKEKDNKYFHLIALAKNEAGRIALNELVTKSNFEGFYFKPRVDLEMMKPYAENLIVSSACLASKFSKEQDEEKCVEYIEEYKEIFPHFYLEMQSHDTADQKAYNQKILKLAHWTNTPFIITTDSHAATKEDLKYQGYHVKIARDSETESEIYSGCYMQTDEEIHAIMDSQIGRENVTVALEETDRIADLIEEVNMPFQSPQLPTYPLPEGYTDNAAFLRDLCEKGWGTRHIDEMSEEEQKIRRERLEYELGIIHQMGFDGYFLIVWDFINYAKSHDIIVGDGRGCFTKDALIWCKDKLKTIDAVDVGDEVLSADGNFHKVLKTFKYNINEPTIEFTYKQQGSSRKKYVNRCTMDHHVLVHRDGKNEYVPAKSLKVGDLLCSPKVKSNQNAPYIEIDLNDYNFQGFKYDDNYIYEETNVNKSYPYSPGELSLQGRYSKCCFQRLISNWPYDENSTPNTKIVKWLLDNTPFKSLDEYCLYAQKNNKNYRKIPRKIVIDENVNYFFGIMYGDGWVRKRTNEFGLAVHAENHKNTFNKQSFYDFCGSVGLDENDITIRPSKTTKCIQYVVSSNVIHNFLKSMLFVSEKHSLKQFNCDLLNQRLSCLESFYQGLFSTDGSGSFVEGKKCFDNTSSGLISAFKTINSQMGYEPMALDVRLSHDDNRGYHSVESYKLRNIVNRQIPFKNDADFWYLPVESVKAIDSEPILVYDLSVAEEHNFVINNVVVHNSGGGSLVNYLIGISELDPIEYDLIFERFLNPERVSMPDIDIDFADRESIINYLCQKYGDDKVCQVINFSYITPIVAIKDVGRVLGIPYYICEKISKKFAYPTFDECVQNSPDLYEKYAEYGELFEIAAHISGRVRNVSIHAGGVGIVDTKITDYMAMKLGGNGEHVIQVDKRKIEEIGIIKFDILGVATLGVVQEVKKAVGLTDWDLSVANPAFIHDEKMYKLLQEAKTNGVFQVESSGMKDLLVRLKPTSLEDVSAVLALYRPDSMSMLEDYIYYKHHPTEVKYWHPDMEPLLNKTYGCIIYQEEIMDIVRVFGGRSRGGADLFRKAIGKKNVELVKKESEKLYSEILIQGYEEWLAKQISDYLAKMGGYSFNKCVSGDTKLVRISQQKNQFLPTVAEMYRIKNDRKYAVQTGHSNLHRKYLKTYGFSLSMDKDGRVRKNRIVDIRYSGMREVFQITTESGAKVKATDNHKIPTSHGVKLLKELKIGDELFVIGDYEVCKNTYNLTDGNFESNCPKIGEMGFQFKEYSVTNNYNNTKAEKKGQQCSCEICGKPYDENARFELHHKDFDRTNNDCDNFSWLCASCHKKEHYRKNNRKKSYQKGYPTKLEKIISIESVGVTETYDVEMEAPNHNFTVESGIIVCNSHSALYSILTLKTAYLKAHYPAHFFCALLNQNKGNYGTINKYILDAKDFGVEVLPPKINLSSNNFTVQNGKILFGFEAVNGIGKQLADKIIEQRKISKFTGFKDFLERVAPSAKQVVYLTKAGAFPAKDKQNFLLKYAKSLFPVRSYEPVSSLPKLSILKEKFGIDTDVIKDKEERLRLYNQAREHDFNIQQVNKYQTHMSDFAEKYLPDPAFWEFEALSVFIQNNPFEEAYQYISKTFDDIDEGEECIVVGVISNVQKKKDRNKNQYAFINLYSAFGLVELTCWHSQFKKFEELIKRGTQIAVLAEKKTDKAIVIEMKSYQSWLKSRHILKE